MGDEEHSIPAIHAGHLAEVAARLGVSRAKLFSGTGVTEAMAADPHARMTVAATERLVHRARALTGEPAIGVLLGMQMRVSAHGYLGFAAMAASTIGEALEIATRFAPTRTDALALHLHVTDERASLVIEELADFGTARDVVVFALLEGIRQIGHALTGHPMTGAAHVAFAEPDYYARSVVRHRGHVHFGKRTNALLFDPKVLALPLMMADPAAFQLATEQCERELTALGTRARTTQRVSVALRRSSGGLRSLEEIAAVLKLSTRTLKRRLAEEGTTFRDLLDDARKERALLLLQSTSLGVEAIAGRVGYSDVANFTRAVRRWTGETPARLRA